tara:strand:- start:132 stop:830 length:699 start_codon:yes stop_codon:yes gene_type:complete
MRKFWKRVQVKKKSSNSYEILLDNNSLKTPMKKELIIQNLKIAQEIHKEWNQDKNILDTDAMIFYGIISTSIDKISNNRILYINDILNFIDTDLICYRAEKPNDLVKWQSKNWNPILLKVEKYINHKIDVFTGIMPSKQNNVIKFKINKILTKLSDLEIIALHRITNITGSAFLSLCILNNDIVKEKVFDLAYLDELWQAENWGHEEEASNNREKINIELNRTIYFLDCLKS